MYAPTKMQILKHQHNMPPQKAHDKEYFTIQEYDMKLVMRDFNSIVDKKTSTRKQ